MNLRSYCFADLNLLLFCHSRRCCFIPKGWFPVSRNFCAYVHKIYVRKWNRGNAWKIAHKRKSWTLLNFSFKFSTFYLASILFTWLKFTCVNVRSQKRISGNQPLYFFFAFTVWQIISFTQHYTHGLHWYNLWTVQAYYFLFFFSF